MHRFYVPGFNPTTHQIQIIDQNELHHLKDVLRLKQGDAVLIFNGTGDEAEAAIKSISQRSATLSVQYVRTSKPKSPQIILACAIPKKGKFDLIIEKATELNADIIIPLLTQRSEVKLPTEKNSGKATRYSKILVSAAKQCGRNTVPAVTHQMSIKDAVSHHGEYGLLIIPSLFEKKISLINVLMQNMSAKKIMVLIGPEGDFTPEEYAAAQKLGCIPVSLGDNILRVETAALCALSCINVCFNCQP